MKAPLRIAIAGLGTVGVGVIKMLQTHEKEITQRAGRAIEIVCINARDAKKDRGVDISGYVWESDAGKLAARDDVDVIVELIGGSEGVAKNLVEQSLVSKKSVVTANKALLAKHGVALATMAEKNGVDLNYEASVAGGIPIIKALREGFAGNKINGIYGILNGTCNYILTEMRETGCDFQSVLKDAQEKGYAESDPTFDVDGIDAAHKLCILTAIGFGVKPDFERLSVTGIRHIGAKDIGFASDLGCKIKLLGIARDLDGRIEQSLEPCLVPTNCALGSVEGVFNAVFVEGDFVDRSMLEGRGAGEGPTASAVVADLIDLARGISIPTYGLPVAMLKDAQWAQEKDILSEQYIHLVVTDQAGVIADVTAILRDFGISIETMLQRSRDPGQPVSVVITTHECSRHAMRQATDKLSELQCVRDAPTVLRIVRF